MITKRVSSGGLIQLLNSDQIRRVELEGHVYYAAKDVVAALAEQADVGQYWGELLKREPRLAELFQQIASETDGTLDFVDLAGVFRLAEAIDSPRAENQSLVGRVRPEASGRGGKPGAYCSPRPKAL